MLNQVQHDRIKAFRISELKKKTVTLNDGARRPLVGRKKFSPQTVLVCNDLSFFNQKNQTNQKNE